MVAEDERDHEERDAEEYGNASDQVDEMVYLFSDRRLAGVKAGCQASDPSHDRLIATADHHSLRGAFNGIRREEREIFRFQRVLVRELRRPRLGLGFTGQRAIIHFESPGLDDANVGRYTIAELHVHYVAQYQFLRLQRQLLALPDHRRDLRYHVLERLHDLAGLALLVIREYASHYDDRRQHDAQVQVVVVRVLAGRCLDRVRDETEDRADPQQ